MPPSAQYQRRRRHQQHDQGHQAPRLRVPRRAILLPQDPRRVPRDSAMNQKFPVSTSPKSRRQPKSLAARASAHLSFPDRFDHWRSPSAHVMFSSDE
ncbi:hypothetical protein BOC36_35385 [Burkholderia pseudomallei]|nr:hypothetical protein BOC36_35385 [Burkholderia pseudomallei]